MALPHCPGALGSATPAMYYLTAWGQRAVELLQYTASLPGGSGQGNSCIPLGGLIPYPYSKDFWILYLGVSSRRTGGTGQYIPGAPINSGYSNPLISLVCACGSPHKGGVASNRRPVGPRRPFRGGQGGLSPLSRRVPPCIGHDPQAWEGSARHRAPPTSAVGSGGGGGFDSARWVPLPQRSGAVAVGSSSIPGRAGGGGVGCSGGGGGSYRAVPPRPLTLRVPLLSP